jgi:hypothetical protein
VLKNLLPVDQMPAPTRVGRYWLWIDGSITPVVAGGSTGQGEGGDPPEPKGDPDPKGEPDKQITTTQASLDASAAAIRREAERRAKKDAEKSLSDALGCSLDEAKQIIADRKAEKEASATEAEKREAAAKEREDKAAERERLAAEKGLRADAKAALAEAGVNPERLKRATAMLLGDLEADADEEAVTAAAAALKTEMPELFGTVKGGNGAPSGDPSGGPGASGKKSEPIGIEAGRAAAQAKKAAAAKNTNPDADPLGFARKIG